MNWLWYQLDLPLAIAGTAAQAIAGPTQAASGAETFAGSAAQATGGPVQVAGGSEIFAGTAAQSFVGPTQSESGAEAFAGSASQTVASPTQAAAAREAFAAAGASLLPTGPTQSAAAVETFAGSAASISGSLAQLAAGIGGLAGAIAQVIQSPRAGLPVACAPPPRPKAFPRDDMRRLFWAISGGAHTVWTSDPRPNLTPSPGGMRAYLVLQLTSYASVGVDDYRQAICASTGNLETVVCGVRLVTVSARASSLDSQRQAYDILEHVRLRLRGMTARTVYAAHNLAFVRTMPIAVYETSVDGRVMLGATMDSVFAWASNQDPGDDIGDTIQTVNVDMGSTLPLAASP